MEKSLTPMQRAFRKFSSGRPPASPVNTPLGAIALITAQRSRLKAILAEIEGATITSAAVVIRFPHANVDGADTILVKEGLEGEAVSTLEMYGPKPERQFVISGLFFVVQSGDEKRFFAQPIERTPEGLAAMQRSFGRQIDRTPEKNMA